MEKSSSKKNIGFITKQRDFLKMYLITYVSKGKRYGQSIYEVMCVEFEKYGYKPTQSEVYRALHELHEEGILEKRNTKVDGAKYKEVATYTISDEEAAKKYRRIIKKDVERSFELLRKAIRENSP